MKITSEKSVNLEVEQLMEWLENSIITIFLTYF